MQGGSQVSRAHLIAAIAAATVAVLMIFAGSAAAGTIVLVSASSSGEMANGASARDVAFDPGSGVSYSADTIAISADGRYVAFSSRATNLVPGDTNGAIDVFVRDVQAGTTERVSVSSTSGQGDGDSGVEHASTNGRPVAISADGRYVAFTSFATNLVPGDIGSWALSTSWTPAASRRSHRTRGTWPTSAPATTPTSPTAWPARASASTSRTPGIRLRPSRRRRRCGSATTAATSPSSPSRGSSRATRTTSSTSTSGTARAPRLDERASRPTAEKAALRRSTTT